MSRMPPPPSRPNGSSSSSSPAASSSQTRAAPASTAAWVKGAGASKPRPAASASSSSASAPRPTGGAPSKPKPISASASAPPPPGVPGITRPGRPPTTASVKATSSTVPAASLTTTSFRPPTPTQSAAKPLAKAPSAPQPIDIPRAPAPTFATSPVSPVLSPTAAPPRARPPPPSRGRVVVALYDYDAPNDGDLSIRVGDEIVVLSEENDWYEGELRGARGYFPASYVTDKSSASAPSAAAPRAARAAPQAGGRRALNARLVGPEKRKDTTTKESFYLYVIDVDGAVIYRRVSEWRTMYVHVCERFTDRRGEVPDFPITKESILTNYSKLGDELAVWLDAFCQISEDILRCDIVQDFFRQTARDLALAKSGDATSVNNPSIPPPVSAGLGIAAPPLARPAAVQPIAANVMPRLSASPRSLTARIVGRVKVGEGLDRHYEYQLEVAWDGEKYHITRRYSEFHAMQIRLLESFPVEAGMNDPAQRVIPFIPGKVLFGRSQIAGVADQRMVELDKYLQELLRLDDRLAKSALVLDFVRPSDKDLASKAAPPQVDRSRAASPPPSQSKQQRAATAAVKAPPRPAQGSGGSAAGSPSSPVMTFAPKTLGADDMDATVPRCIQYDGVNMFVVEVQRNTGTSYLYRTYDEIYEFHCRLLNAFPGEVKAKTRTIPAFPGKKLFGGGSQEERRRDLHTYVCQLMRLPEMYSRHAEVLRFFASTIDDQLIGAEAEGVVEQSDFVPNDVTRHRGG